MTTWRNSSGRSRRSPRDAAGSGSLHVRAADGDGMNRQAGARALSPWVEKRFCKPICKPDAAGQAETGEMQKAGGDFTP